MPDHKSDDKSTDDKLEKLQQQLTDITDALQRERADATNIRRRHDEQMAGLKDRVKSQVVQDLLPIVDNFERALKHIPKDLEGNDYIKGVQGVVKQFEKTFKDIGVERIKTVGEAFNPKYHDAISMDDDGKGSKEIVSEELQAGYQLGDEVIRHAMVRVKLG